MNLSLSDLLILALATWRLSYMVTSESGWFGVFEIIRNRIGGATTCIYCFSVWASIGLYLIYHTGLQVIVIVLAVSGLALVIRSYTGVGLHDRSL